MERAIEVWVGCAGWTIPKTYVEWFPSTGSHLQRYATRFPAVEINSSFYKLHRPSTYAQWFTVVPESFKFSVKLPRQITHMKRLTDISMLDNFLTGISALGGKLGPLLVQLPPSLAYEVEVANAFFTALRERFNGEVACEPRHPSWFAPEAEKFLREFRVARVAADPAPVPAGEEPGGWTGLVYYRLHGSPRMYYSAYSTSYLNALTQKLIMASRSAQTWCIFNNTASGAAIENALTVLQELHVADRTKTGEGKQ